MHFPLSGFERKSAEFLGYCANKKGFTLFWGIVSIVVIALCYLIYGLDSKEIIQTIRVLIGIGLFFVGVTLAKKAKQWEIESGFAIGLLLCGFGALAVLIEVT